MILGALVALSPYLGLPLSMLGVILPLIGLVVVAIAFTIRQRNASPRDAMPVQVLPYDPQEV